LKKCGYKQTDERPFDGPNTPLGGINGWIYNSVLVGMTEPTMTMLHTMVIVMGMLMFGHKDYLASSFNDMFLPVEIGAC
jgi:hypothetical protein